MSEINGKYKQIMKDLEEHIKDPEELEFVKNEFSELSMLFIDMLDRVTKLTDMKVQEIETRQQEIITKINNVQEIVDGIESDIYEDDDYDSNYEFEIVCPYCNHEFTADIEEENNEEIECPECHNTIELDWNGEEDGCSDDCCSHCNTTQCEKVAEQDDEYDIDNDIEEDDEEDDKDDM